MLINIESDINTRPTIKINHWCQLGDPVPPTARYPPQPLIPDDWKNANIEPFSTFPPYTVD